MVQRLKTGHSQHQHKPQTAIGCEVHNDCDAVPDDVVVLHLQYFKMNRLPIRDTVYSTTSQMSCF
jgi:hypothetical protein